MATVDISWNWLNPRDTSTLRLNFLATLYIKGVIPYIYNKVYNK